MAEIDTSSYPKPVNPLVQQGQAIQNGTGMVNLMLQGMDLHAKQAIGNAIATNTDPETGQVDTNNMMATVARSGNPLAQQQAAQLAQSLQMSQSENQVKQLAASNSKNQQIGQALLSMGLDTKGNMDDINGVLADHIGDAQHEWQTPANAVELHQALARHTSDADRANSLLYAGAMHMVKGGDTSVITPSIDYTDPQTGKTTKISPLKNMMIAMKNGVSSDQNSNPPDQMNPPVNGPSNMGISSPMADPTDVSLAFAGSNPSIQTSEPNNLNQALNKAVGTPSQPPVMPATNYPDFSVPTSVAPSKAAGIKQMQSSVENLNSDADSAYKQSFALQSAKQLLQANPNAIGPIRAAVANMVHTNPALAEGVSNPDNLADTQVLTKLLANAIPKAARSNEDQQVLDSQNPNPSMLYSAAMRAINYQMAQARMPIEKQKAIGPTLNNGGDASGQTTAWSSNNNPMVAEYASLSPAERKVFAAKLSDSQKQQLAQNIKALTSVGAFPELAIKKGSSNGQ